MQNSRRQFYIFDLELAARKAGATSPTMDVVVPVLQRMKDTARTYSLRFNTATMLIGDMAVDAAQQFITLLVRLSDTTTSNSVYSDPTAGQFVEHLKVGNVGSDFGCHVLISTAPEQGLPNAVSRDVLVRVRLGAPSFKRAKSDQNCALDCASAG